MLRLAASCVAVAAGAAPAQTFVYVLEAPAAEEYAWGFPVVTDAESSFYSVQLPIEFNRSVTDVELRDAGVYNGDGEPVPRIFEQTTDDVASVTHRAQLPMLPLYETTENRTDDIRLVFEQDGGRIRLELDTDDLLSGGAARLTSYIVDARSLDQPVETLELDWPGVETGFIGRIDVAGSDNLDDWSDIGSGAVAELREGSASIVRKHVHLNGSRHDFLRIRWRDMPEAWRLSAVNGSYTVGVTNTRRELVTVDPSAVDSGDSGVIFDVGGAVLIDQVRVELPEANTVISGRVFYWSEGGQRWIHAGHDSFYHVGRGDNSIMSEPMRTNLVRTSRLKFVATRGTSKSPLKLELGWRPDRLLFLAQGSGPFTLVAGRAADAGDNFPQQRLYGDRSIAQLAARNGGAAEATLGPRFALAGTDSLVRPYQFNWRTWALWAGLALGVLLVGFMASRVVRDLKS